MTRRRMLAVLSGLLPRRTATATAAEAYGRPNKSASHALESLVLQVSIAGLSVEALVDTGASSSIISRSLAKRLGISSQRASQVISDSGTTTLERSANSVSVEMLGIALVSAAPFIADLSEISEATGISIDLVLGQDLLRKVMLVRESRTGMMKVLQSPPVGAEWRRLDLTRTQEGRLCIDASVDSSPLVAAVLDLGSSNALMMSQGLSDKMRLTTGRRVSSAATATITGIKISKTVSVRTVALADFVQHDVPCEIFGDWSDPSVPLNIGLPLFLNSDLIIDLGQNRLYVKKSPSRALVFSRDRSGLGLSFRGDRLVVVHVAANSPAELAGWRIGDVILAVDGTDIDGRYPGSELSGWRSDAHRRLVTLKIEGGPERMLKLERYF